MKGGPGWLVDPSRALGRVNSFSASYGPWLVLLIEPGVSFLYLKAGIVGSEAGNAAEIPRTETADSQGCAHGYSAGLVIYVEYFSLSQCQIPLARAHAGHRWPNQPLGVWWRWGRLLLARLRQAWLLMSMGNCGMSAHLRGGTNSEQIRRATILTPVNSQLWKMVELCLGGVLEY